MASNSRGDSECCLAVQVQVRVDRCYPNCTRISVWFNMCVCVCACVYCCRWWVSNMCQSSQHSKSWWQCHTRGLPEVSESIFGLKCKGVSGGGGGGGGKVGGPPPLPQSFRLHTPIMPHQFLGSADCHIVGNFRGRKLSRIGKEWWFREENFRGKSLTNLHGCGHSHSAHACTFM